MEITAATNPVLAAASEGAGSNAGSSMLHGWLGAIQNWVDTREAKSAGKPAKTFDWHAAMSTGSEFRPKAGSLQLIQASSYLGGIDVKQFLR